MIGSGFSGRTYPGLCSLCLALSSLLSPFTANGVMLQAGARRPMFFCDGNVQCREQRHTRHRVDKTLLDSQGSDTRANTGQAQERNKTIPNIKVSGSDWDSIFLCSPWPSGQSQTHNDVPIRDSPCQSMVLCLGMCWPGTTSLKLAPVGCKLLTVVTGRKYTRAGVLWHYGLQSVSCLALWLATFAAATRLGRGRVDTKNLGLFTS